MWSEEEGCVRSAGLELEELYEEMVASVVTYRAETLGMREEHLKKFGEPGNNLQASWKFWIQSKKILTNLAEGFNFPDSGTSGGFRSAFVSWVHFV